MSLIVEREQKDLTSILKLRGVLDFSTTNLINPYLEEIKEIDELIIDFSELEFIDSTGIGSILDAIHMSQEKNFKIELTGVNDLAHEVFEMVGVYTILNAVQGGEQ
ncbi:STAS domain-containing protein [Aquibacillus sediminis]|uniref:STAS domain-containing protein n=1 Tax=Aquibacillus sediminis TaxID=2574734 RepID=UPI001109EF48|nr:STAS domain-containing protein [Aquibacillus sediminis]